MTLYILNLICLKFILHKFYSFQRNIERVESSAERIWSNFSQSYQRQYVRFCCLSVAVCSSAAAGCGCMNRARYTCLQCAWDRPTNKVRTVDRVRVNGW